MADGPGDPHDRIFDKIRASAPADALTTTPRSHYMASGGPSSLPDVVRQTGRGLAAAGVGMTVSAPPSSLDLLSSLKTVPVPSVQSLGVLADIASRSAPIQALRNMASRTTEEMNAYYGQPQTQAGRDAYSIANLVGSTALGAAVGRVAASEPPMPAARPSSALDFFKPTQGPSAMTVPGGNMIGNYVEPDLGEEFWNASRAFNEGQKKPLDNQKLANMIQDIFGPNGPKVSVADAEGNLTHAAGQDDLLKPPFASPKQIADANKAIEGGFVPPPDLGEPLGPLPLPPSNRMFGSPAPPNGGIARTDSGWWNYLAQVWKKRGFGELPEDPYDMEHRLGVDFPYGSEDEAAWRARTRGNPDPPGGYDRNATPLDDVILQMGEDDQGPGDIPGISNSGDITGISGGGYNGPRPKISHDDLAEFNPPGGRKMLSSFFPYGDDETFTRPDMLVDKLMADHSVFAEDMPTSEMGKTFRDIITDLRMHRVFGHTTNLPPVADWLRREP